ncbi:transposase [Streptomyces sp. NPDC096191]|uniref:transposase n=1 Tax=Streptomyces sp. NPDC096191 TaxID=3155426 RepID=UPI00332B3654
MNAIFYQNRTGCQWAYLPHDLPAWSAVFYYFTLWRQDGLDQRIQELLRCQVREKARRLEDPSWHYVSPPGGQEARAVRAPVPVCPLQPKVGR